MKKAIVGSVLVALFVAAIGLIYSFNKTQELEIFNISWDDEEDDIEDFWA
jgi:hypothetical protein